MSLTRREELAASCLAWSRLLKSRTMVLSISDLEKVGQLLGDTAVWLSTEQRLFEILKRGMQDPRQVLDLMEHRTTQP